MRFESEINKQKIRLEYLNQLESKCKGLENLLCKNFINVISKKIDNIEKKFAGDSKDKKLKNIEIGKNELEDKRIEALNYNIGIIESSLNNNILSPDISTSELISRKIEENYKLLDELEKSNKPIFTINTETQNKVAVEDKIRQMDDKLGTIFSEYREKCRNTGQNDLSNLRQEHNEYKRELNFIPELKNNPDYSECNPAHNGNKVTKETKLKELRDKLSNTEKKIKEISGTLLKNF